MSTNEDDVALISWLNCMINFVPKNRRSVHKIQSLDEIRKVRCQAYRFKSLGLTTQKQQDFLSPLQSLCPSASYPDDMTNHAFVALGKNTSAD